MIEVSFIRKILGLSSLISALILIWCNIEGLKCLFILPLLYFICMQFILPQNLKLNGGLLIVFLVLTFRYDIYPVILFEQYTPITGIEHYGNDAIFYMSIEMCVIFTTIRCFFNKKRESLVVLNEISVINLLIPFLLLVIALFFVIQGNDYFSGKHFIWETSSIVEKEVKTNGLVIQIYKWFEAFAIITLLSKLARKYYKNRTRIYYYLSIVVCFIPCIVYSGQSRLSLLIPLVCSCAMAYKIFGGKSKYAISIALSSGLIVLTVLSIYKNIDSTGNAQTSDLFNPFLLNVYFGGVENVVIGLQTFERYGINIIWAIFDSMRNAMGISSYFEFLPGAGMAFNSIVYGGVGVGDSYDQIVPTIIQGMLYFGKFLFFIPTIIMTYVVCKCDYLFGKTKSIEMSYLYAYFPVVVAWAIPGNMMHLTTQFFNFYIPMLLLFTANRWKIKNK